MPHFILDLYHGRDLECYNLNVEVTISSQIGANKFPSQINS